MNLGHCNCSGVQDLAKWGPFPPWSPTGYILCCVTIYTNYISFKNSLKLNSTEVEIKTGFKKT